MYRWLVGSDAIIDLQCLRTFLVNHGETGCIVLKVQAAGLGTEVGVTFSGLACSILRTWAYVHGEVMYVIFRF